MAKTKLVLKKELKGKIIEARIERLGVTTFDTNKVSENEFENYAKNGFAHCFETEEVKEQPKQKSEPKNQAKGSETEGAETEGSDEEEELDLDLEEDEAGKGDDLTPAEKEAVANAEKAAKEAAAKEDEAKKAAAAQKKKDNDKARRDRLKAEKDAAKAEK